MKSELKMIESGFMKTPCIVSNVEPYTLLANKRNCLMVKPERNEIDFFAGIRRMSLDKNLRDDLAEQLYEDVKVKYHIDTVNVERKQIFEQWLK
jgi:glycosyltransferase involved in cell wall biosynthesis